MIQEKDSGKSWIKFWSITKTHLEKDFYLKEVEVYLRNRHILIEIIWVQIEDLI